MTAESQSPTIDPLRKPLRKAIRTALKRSRKKLEKLHAEIEACQSAVEWLECGELIKANLDTIERGTEIVELPDLYHPGQTRIIELEPRLKPLDNAKKYFKRHRKLTKGEPHILEQIERETAHESALSAFSESYSAWEDEADIGDAIPEAFKESALSFKIHIPGLQAKPKPSDKKSTPDGVRTFISRDNLTIYVGKGARENDHLSMRVARGNDWWFHIAHLQGSHVLVRNPHGSKKDDRARQALPQETLLDAAHLAVYFSKGRRATRAEIHYCQAKNLRKAKKAPPGQVTVQNGKTLSLRVEQTRLDRLLSGDGT